MLKEFSNWGIIMNQTSGSFGDVGLIEREVYSLKYKRGFIRG